MKISLLSIYIYIYIYCCQSITSRDQNISVKANKMLILPGSFHWKDQTDTKAIYNFMIFRRNLSLYNSSISKDTPKTLIVIMQMRKNTKYCKKYTNILYIVVPYNAVSYLLNTLDTHPIIHSWGWGMGCLLWVQSLIKILPWSLQWCKYYRLALHHVTTALHCLSVSTLMTYKEPWKATSIRQVLAQLVRHQQMRWQYWLIQLQDRIFLH